MPDDGTSLEAVLVGLQEGKGKRGRESYAE